MPGEVFISYRHESLQHAGLVRRLGELLRKSGIPVVLDQFYLDDNPGGPNDGWPKWCEDRATKSACVIIVASGGWFAAYEKSGEAGTGLGAATEADVFRQQLWDEKGHNSRIRLAFLHKVDAEKVPTRLRQWHHFRPFDDDKQLDGLARWVAGCLNLGEIETPTVSWPAPLDFEPDLADRSKKEWPAIVDMLAGTSRARILLYEGISGRGKSLLIRQTLIYAKKLKLPIVHIDFKGTGLDVPEILGQFQLEIAQYLPNFSHEPKTHLLRKDLRSLRQPVLVVFDTYEAAVANKPLEDWLTLQFLPEVETSLCLSVIVCGQKVPDPSKAGWRDLSRSLPLEPIMEMEHWEAWIKRHHPGLREKGVDFRTVLLIAKGNPSQVAAMCEAISAN
jgi:hypothetical protein